MIGYNWWWIVDFFYTYISSNEIWFKLRIFIMFLWCKIQFIILIRVCICYNAMDMFRNKKFFSGLYITKWIIIIIGLLSMSWGGSSGVMIACTTQIQESSGRYCSTTSLKKNHFISLSCPWLIQPRGSRVRYCSGASFIKISPH